LRTNFSASNAIMYMPVMDAYQDIIGTMRALVRDVDGKQDGDPAKAARALDLALQAGNTPLRLQVGADSIAAVRAHAEQLLNDLAAWEKVGSDIRIDPKARTPHGTNCSISPSAVLSPADSPQGGARRRAPPCNSSVRRTIMRDTLELAGRKALVTGGTKGIGAAVPAQLRQAGAGPDRGADAACRSRAAGPFRGGGHHHCRGLRRRR
jgi:hypothetical protein